MPRKVHFIAPSLLLFCLLGSGYTVADNNTTLDAEQQTAPPGYEVPLVPESEAGNGFFYTLPRLIDATPTILPEQSNEPIVPPTHETEEQRSEEHTSELQSRPHLVCRLLLEKKK